MNLKLIDDPHAMQMLNSLVIELSVLETATGRIRAQLDVLLTKLTAEPAAFHDAAGAGQPVLQGGEAAESPAAQIATDVVVDEARLVEAGAACAGLETADGSEFGEASTTDAAVIGLCARIEASVAEFAAAAEVAHASVEDDGAVEPPLEVVGCVENASEELDPAAVAKPTEIDGEPTGEPVAVSFAPVECAADELTPEGLANTVTSRDEPVGGVSDEVSETAGSAPLEIVTGVPAVPANSNIAEDVAAVAADAPSVAGKVVVLEVKRRVWPQRLAGCASVLLVAAAAVVVATMPDLIGIAI